MNNQLVLLGIGLFIGLMVVVATVDQYLLNEHDPREPQGLLWRSQTAFSRIRDLEVVLAISENQPEDRVIRMLVQLLNGQDPVMSVRYLDPTTMRDELFTINRDLLSHYLPQENLVVIKRWIGLPLAAVGLASLDISQLEKDWRAGRIHLRVIQDISGFSRDLFPTAIVLSETISGCQQYPPSSICSATEEERFLPGFAGFEEGSLGASIQGGYILEVTHAQSGELLRMIWIDRESYLVRNVVFFANGKRTASLRVERITLDQGLTEEAILALPRGVEIIRG